MDAKKARQVNFRLDEETFAKLEDMKAKSGVDGSKIIRTLIWEGEVNVHYGQREIIQRLSSIHDSFNRDMLEIRRDGQKLQKSIDELLIAAKSNNDERIHRAAAKAECVSEYLAEKSLDKQRDAEKELKECVDF